MTAGDVVHAKSLVSEFRNAAGSGRITYSATGGKRRKKGGPEPAFVLLFLGLERDLEHPSFSPERALNSLGWYLQDERELEIERETLGAASAEDMEVEP